VYGAIGTIKRNSTVSEAAIARTLEFLRWNFKGFV